MPSGRSRLCELCTRCEEQGLSGAAATEDALKAEAANCRILHLANHGIVNNASPMYSQVVLAQAPRSTDDGLLEAWEVMHMYLNADLVVLAACQTARGRYAAGEEMIGLSWAFFVAGCPTTVVSQWDVFALSTTDLMIDFHKNLKAGMTKAESLRQAEPKMMKGGKYEHPFLLGAICRNGRGKPRYSIGYISRKVQVKLVAALIPRYFLSRPLSDGR